MNKLRVIMCAEFLEGMLEDLQESSSDLEELLEELLDDSLKVAALRAGFLEAEIVAAWDIVNEQEGA